MIEAVNSVISGASSARNIAVEATASNAAASNFELGDQIARAPTAPFVSPYYAVDTNYNTAVLQIRDSETGDVLKQYPSESRLEQRAEEAERSATTEPASTPTNRSAPSESSVFRATAISQQGGQSGVVNSAGAAEAQAAISALSAGAQSGQVSAAAVNVTA